MRSVNILAAGTRLVLFLLSLYASLGTVAVVLHNPAGRLAFGIVLLLVAVGVLLAAGAWMLRRLWVLSGRAATALTTTRTAASNEKLSAAAECENEARA